MMRSIERLQTRLKHNERRFDGLRLLGEVNSNQIDAYCRFIAKALGRGREPT